MLGWFLPSSRFLVESMLKRIDWSRARVIVEYGPGVGNITGQILKRMRPDARLVVLETNGDFIQFLRQSFSDARLHVAHESAEEVNRILDQLNLQPADYVISGIPFSLLPEEVRQSIIHKTHAVLRPDGAFLVYQFSNAVHPYLRRTFRSVRHNFEIRNILPAHLYHCVP